MLAAGRGTRFGGPLPKAYLQLGGQTLLLRSAARLVQSLPPATPFELVVVRHPDDDAAYLAPHLPALRSLVQPSGRLLLADGGDTRQQSTRNGLAALATDVDLVLVHDAARALLPVAATRRCLEVAAEVGAALLAIPAPDTLKKVAADRVTNTLDRAGVWMAQTPQVIRRDLLLRAFAHAEATGFLGTDDVSLVEHLGEPVAVVPGSAHNLKITRPEDLPLAAAVLGAGLA